MAPHAAPTAFVTGASGFIGVELVKLLVAAGFQVYGLVRSPESKRRVQRAGGTAITGDLLVPGQWQDEAAADWVFHIPPSARARVPFWKRARRIGCTRARMDAHLLDAVADGATKRIVYVADSLCYGATGPRPVTETELSLSRGRGWCLAPSLDRLDGYVISGLPLVTALPGCVYGNASWFRNRIVDPINNGRRVVQFAAAGPWVSPIHVHDCARALIHIAARGEVGGRYFLANSEQVRLNEFAETFARLARRRLRVWRVPAAAARFLSESRLTDHARGDHAYSNIRLRGTGFHFRYPTLEQGIKELLRAVDE